jgi:hypothetical protein
MAADPGVLFSMGLLLTGGAVLAGFAFICVTAGLRFVGVTIAAIVIGIFVGVVTAKLGYMVAPLQIRLQFGFVPSVLSQVAFGLCVGTYIKLRRPAKAASAVAVISGVTCVLVIGVPFLVYIACQYGECINL